MLAPRKTLYSTPLRVFTDALALVAVTSDDVLYDVGCGDGRLLIEAATRFGVRAVGIEIDAERVRMAREAAEAAQVAHLVTIHYGNALEFDLADATVIFLFLVNRGLKLIRPKLEALTRPVRVVTYLYTFAAPVRSTRHFLQAKDNSDQTKFPVYLSVFPQTAHASSE